MMDHSNFLNMASPYAIYAISIVISTYPGPLFAKLTELYAGSHAFKKDLHLEILRCHEKYGPIVRLAPNRLVFNSVTALQDIYQSDRLSKAYTYGNSVRNNVDNVFTARDKDVHRSRRKMIAPPLSERAMKSFEPTIEDNITVYLKQILKASRTSQPVNMSERVKYLALDIVTRLSFGYPLDTQTKEENRFVSKALAFGLYRGNIWHHVYFLSRLWVYRVFDWIFFESREKYSRLLDKMIRSRVARGPNGERDFYSFISELGTDPDNVRKGELWWEAHFLVVAGSDTTATAVSATFFYLSRNPKCYEKLAREIRSTFESAHDIEAGPQLASCRYLRACINEALRMSPSVPGALWRSQDPNDNQPLIIDGHVIPKGTLVGVSAYAIHHNKEYFPDPFKFKPERWLEGQTPASKLMYDAFAAFSVGSRSCPGKSMAYLESSLVLAKTLWYFEFKVASGSLAEAGGGRVGGPPGRTRPQEFQLEDIFTARHDGPYLVFRSRDESRRDLEQV
ncbi:cytochrome P450 [Hypoxylon rubiginosum]|uniref:Cytochrome P450 n=1 Tax=Hypoxylon rubiginosum TaxID=110542 RepID=A0ACB9ZAA9_9PEZI|nr:cytochrome P450 [Hypoxylon rubiginosum]